MVDQEKCLLLVSTHGLGRAGRILILVQPDTQIGYSLRVRTRDKLANPFAR